MNNHSEHRNSTPELPGEVADWLSEEPAENARAIQKVWTLAGHAQQFDPIATPDEVRFNEMRAAVLSSAKPGSQSSDRPGPKLRLISPLTLRIAASLLLLVLVGVFWWTRPVAYEAPLGDSLQLTLSDGSGIVLNSGSRLTLRRSFGKNDRDLTLDGEAFFDVAHASVPFNVSTFNGTITVLGTRFNVRAWTSDDQPETVVALEEGSVLLRNELGDAAEVILKPGEVSRISGSDRPSVPSLADLNQALAWRQGAWMFVDKGVGVIADEVSRRFDVVIDIQPASLRQERVTVRLNEARNAEEVLSLIAVARGFQLEASTNSFKLTRP